MSPGDKSMSLPGLPWCAETCIIVVLKVRLGVSTEYHYGNWNLTKSLKHKGI